MLLPHTPLPSSPLPHSRHTPPCYTQHTPLPPTFTTHSSLLHSLHNSPCHTHQTTLPATLTTHPSLLHSPHTPPSYTQHTHPPCYTHHTPVPPTLSTHPSPLYSRLCLSMEVTVQSKISLPQTLGVPWVEALVASMALNHSTGVRWLSFWCSLHLSVIDCCHFLSLRLLQQHCGHERQISKLSATSKVSIIYQHLPVMSRYTSWMHLHNPTSLTATHIKLSVLHWFITWSTMSWQGFTVCLSGAIPKASDNGLEREMFLSGNGMLFTSA